MTNIFAPCVCVFSNRSDILKLLIFGGTDKQIKDTENQAYEYDVLVLFHKKAWIFFQILMDHDTIQSLNLLWTISF